MNARLVMFFTLVIVLGVVVPVIVLPSAVLIIGSEKDDLIPNFRAVQMVLSLLLSLLAFVISIMSYASARYDRRKDNRKSINDEFWFRTVLLPAFYEPMSRALDQQDHLFEHDRQNFDIEKFNSAVLQIRDLSKWFAVVDTQIVEDIGSLLDGLESHVAHQVVLSDDERENLPTEDTDSARTFQQFRLELFSLLHKMHRDLANSEFPYLVR
jgi:hypothetical protein